MNDLINFFKEEMFQMLLESKFSIIELNSKKELSEKIKYCKNLLKILGKGTTRVSFYLPKMNHVLKLASNEIGVKQNEVECNKKKANYKIFTKVYKHADDFSWIECEYAKDVSRSEFKELTELSYSDFGKILYILGDNYFTRKYDKEFISANFSKDELARLHDRYDNIIKNNDFIQEFSEYLYNEKPDAMFIADLIDNSAISNYGVVKRNNKEFLVVRDHGLNKKIMNMINDLN